MTVYFVQAILIVFAGIVSGADKSRRSKKKFMIFAFSLLIIVSALRSRNIGTDLAIHYADKYEQVARCSWSELADFAQRTTFEYGYCVFTKLLSVIDPDVQFYIAVTSIIIYAVLGRFIYRNSEDAVMSTYLLIFSGTYYNYMNIIRQALAVSVILTGYEVMKKADKKFLRYLVFALFVLLAASFHTASILCLGFILLDMLKFGKKEMMIGTACTFIFFFMYRQIFETVASRMSLNRFYMEYLTKENESVGHINLQSIWMFMVVFMAYLIGIYFMVISKGKRHDIRCSVSVQSSFLLFCGMAASVCRLMVFRMNIINRYSFYFMPFVLLLYPEAINQIHNENNKRIVLFVMYSVMVGYFILMTTMYEASFHRTVPYEFFWQV